MPPHTSPLHKLPAHLTTHLLPLLLLWLIPARSAQAQQQPLPAASEPVPTVETRAQDTSEHYDPRLSSGFVTRVLLKDGAAGEDGALGALERVPGLYIRRQAGYGQPAYIQIRGGNPRQVVVLLNGVRVRLPSGLGFDVGTLATGGVDELLVYRGPAGVVHGGGALTGAIELSVRPKAREQRALRGHVTAGSFKTRELGARAELSERPLTARIAMSVREADGDFPFVDAQGVPARRTNNDHTHLHLIGSGAWRTPSERLGFTLMIDQHEGGVAGPSEFQRAFSQARQHEQRVITTTDALRLDLLSGPNWSLDLGRVFGLQWRGQRYENAEAILGAGELLSTSSAVSSEAGVHASLAVKGSHFATLALGARREQLDQRVERAQVAADALRVTRSTLHAALSDEQILGQGRLSLTSALRSELVEEPTQRWLPLMGALGVIARTSSRRLNVIANVARTARVPDFDELYLETEFVRGDPTLQPERGWMTDAGMRWRMSDEEDAPSVEAVLFSSHIEDQIAFVPITAYLVQARNFDLVRARGVEFAAQAALAPRLGLRGNYTLTDAWRPSLPGHVPLPNQPRHRIDAAARLELSRLTWLLNLTELALTTRAAWRSEITLDAFGSQRDAGWLRLDAGISCAPRSGLTLSLDVTNLLNERGALDGLQRPIPGRALFLSLNLALERLQ